MTVATQAETFVQWPAPKNGAKRRDMGIGHYPGEEEEAEQPMGLTIRFRPEELEDLKLIARLWNSVDAARGVKRKRKWKATSVARYACRLLRDQIAREGEDWPRGAGQQDSWLVKKLAELERELKRKK